MQLSVQQELSKLSLKVFCGVNAKLRIDAVKVVLLEDVVNKVLKLSNSGSHV
jgi:hypothetical protein